ncbi:carboxyl transferase domain-containing protein [Amycolatopsis roodepoortensis]|uniref:Acetyl-coenzyme A carboxylase carboxyl transferase subunits beta/alpha n=1 Tax=Amycolatopsis roodepoortensis TaxID=700274 RepID=A0ABR9L9V4_9PSEU|nr:carboxyl transferase domain-containing protein [Amycolatopsis roodepoortensis]MBE1577469.1 acetyl-CoA carboxylase carboxyl transferase subunit beta [Amycolatopsis roodepoortensis]
MTDPLGWDGYAASLARARERTGTDESVVWERTKIGGHEVVVIRFEFGFLGGSVGTGTGALIERALDEARSHRLPVVSLLSTGGTRMQEGVPALRQLQRIARGLALLREERLPHITVARHPTTGGVWASLGADADVVLAVPGAQVGFAGRRVRPESYADDPAYTAENQYTAGYVDELVAEDAIADRLEVWLGLLTGASRNRPADLPRALGALDSATDGWQAVLRARSADRPRADAYLDDYFDTRVTLRGGAGDGIFCGFGNRGGRPIAFAAQTGIATTPGGFRAATRLIRLAGRLGLPVLTLVDTPGAAADPAAETAGAGNAIAGLFGAIAAAEVPITTLVIGEGGSGGALALCSADRIWLTPDACFSVIAPELAAGILKRDPEDIPALADALKPRPEDLLALGVIDGIAGPEPVTFLR